MKQPLLKSGNQHNVKEKLFSLTRDDFKWDYFRGSGPGGQKKQKTSSACRCTHVESGAVGVSQEERFQHLNRRIAFKKCTEDPKFKNWIRLTAAAMSRGYISLEQRVHEMMRPENIKIEYYKGDDSEET